MPSPAPMADTDAVERIARLHSLNILDTVAEPEFDALARAAAAICSTPIALVSLVDSDRQWFKANIGLEGTTETPYATSFCRQTMAGPGLLVVEDARLDPRFAASPLVVGDPYVVFYAGVPIALADGLRIGALCVVNRVAHRLDSQQRTALTQLANAVARVIESRERARRARDAAADASDEVQRMYASTPAMMHSIDAQGRLLSVSDAWLRTLGYRRDEVIGRLSSDFLSPASRAYAIEQVLPAFFRDGSCEGIEYEMVRKDGTLLDIVLSARTEQVEGRPTRSIAVMQEITARKTVERQLAVSEARYRALVEDQSELVSLTSLDYRIDFANEAYARMFGRTDIVGTSLFDYVDDEAREEVVAHLDMAVRRKVVSSGENYMKLPNGERRWMVWTNRPIIDQHGRVTGLHSVGRDMTERKRVEDDLRTARALLERTGAIAGVGGWEVDLVSGVLTWSDQMCRLFELAPGQQRSVDEVLRYFTSESREVVRRVTRDALRHGKSWDIEVRLRTSRGRTFWGRSVGSVESVGGRPVRLIGTLQDVTANRSIERELAESRELLQVTLESIGDAVITTDVRGNVQWLNPVAERLTGWSKIDAGGRALRDIYMTYDESSRALAADPVAQCLRRNEVVKLGDDSILVARDGSEYAVEDSAAPIRDASGQLWGAVLVFHDVSERRRLAREMSHRARHDSLTGLINRDEFELRLQQLLERCAEAGGQHAVLFVDLDQFKLVNDACGHGVGDRLLREVSRMLKSCARERDTVARLGGDEFGVILEGCGAEAAQVVAQRICDQLDEFRFQHESRRFRVGASIGLVPVDSRWSSIASLIQAADTACYAAKEAGRNRVHTWFDSDRAVRDRQGQIECVQRLEQALDENRFELYGQRIEPVNAPDPNALRFEVLLRMREQSGQIVSPGLFLPIAERFHLASRIDRWVVRRTFEWLTELGPAVRQIDMVSINVSGQSMVEPAFHQYLRELITRARFNVNKVCFEITETSAISSLVDARRFCDEVRGLGVRIALDDFGSGASSFSYLKTLPVDYLKIDGQFVRNMISDPLDQAAVRSFCDVAKVAGVQTIAEFVETPEVLERIRLLGVDMAQGFLIHRPQPLAKLLQGRTRGARRMASAV